VESHRVIVERYPAPHKLASKETLLPKASVLPLQSKDTDCKNQVTLE